MMKKNFVFAILVIVLVLGLVGIKKVHADGEMWIVYGPEMFTVTDGEKVLKGSRVFANPTEEMFFLNFYDNQNELCVLKDGRTWVFGPDSHFGVLASDPSESFQVIDYEYWLDIPTDDFAYNQCWQRPEDFKIFLPMIQN